MPARYGDAVSTKVAILDDYQRVAESYADWTDLDVDFIGDHLTGQALTDRLADREIVVAMRERTPFPRVVLERLPALRMLVTTGMRNASIDVKAANELGIVVTGTRGVRTSTSELTWAMIMTMIRPVATYDSDLRAGRWQRTIGGDLAGSTLGLLGLGNQGRAVAAVGNAFGMHVLAWSPNLTEERAQEGGANLVNREELFATSDIVSVHLVLTEATKGIVGTRELETMRRNTYLVNTSRALLIDQQALRRTIEQEHLAGVALDVFDIEPIPNDHWLLNSPRTLLSPHMGYVSNNSYKAYFLDAAENIRAFLKGTPIRELS